MPGDGRLALTKDVVMKSLGLKGLLNINLSVLLFSLAKAFNGFPSGHANFNRSLPGLE